ncbi:MAG: hypothetical protein JWN34_192, partial [Bryobacterales bacterium]|nr:hypothetical protein [Bryobacterales bacterium]
MHYINFRLHSRVAATILAAGSLLVAQTPSSSSTPDPAGAGGSAAGNGSGQGSSAAGSRSAQSSSTGSGSQASGSQASGSQASGKGQTGSQFTETERTFVQEALEGGRMEVDMGKMASKQGSDSNIKAYGKKLVADHTATNKKLQALAKKNMAGMTNTKSTSMAADSELMSAKGADFDKAFAAMAVQHHQKDIAQFEAAEKDVTNPDLRALITATLPILRDHLQQAQTLSASAGAGATGTTSGSGTGSSSPSGLGTGSSSGAGSSTPGAST